MSNDIYPLFKANKIQTINIYQEAHSDGKENNSFFKSFI